MKRKIHAGDAMDHLKGAGYLIEGVTETNAGVFELIAPLETPERIAAALAIVTAGFDLPMTYEEALARCSLGNASLETRAIVTAEIQRLAEERGV